MKLKKSQRNNIIFALIIALFIIPQTRKPIQVFIHKGLAMFGPSVTDESHRPNFTFDNWQLKDLNNSDLNFKDLKGKVVLLNFWATWCPPCIAELPHLEELHNDYGDKITFILVSNEKQDIVKAFLEKKNFHLNSYTPVSEYPKSLNISSIPRTFLIDKTGHIIIDKTGAANWNSNNVRAQIETLLLE